MIRDDAPVVVTATDEEDIPGPNWRWRRRVRGHPVWGRPYRMAVGAVGTIVVIAGLIMVPLPGQGWLTVLLGVAILATEFEWAERLLERGKAWLQRWNDWVLAQSWFVRGLIALATFVFVAAVMWLTLKLIGLPSFLPESITAWLRSNAAL